LKINGQSVEVRAEPDTPLLWVLRGELHITGTKFGCGMALCGACTVHLDGEPVRACITPLAAVGARAITTIEGLGGVRRRPSGPPGQSWMSCSAAIAKAVNS